MIARLVEHYWRLYDKWQRLRAAFWRLRCNLRAAHRCFAGDLRWALTGRDEK